MSPETVTRLRRAMSDTLDPLVPVGERVALIDFPSSPNVGDNAIWSGEEAYLQGRGARVIYRSDLNGYSRDVLQRRLRGGTILMHGGGNLGDIWEGPQAFRERVVVDFPDTRIVVFPQTMFFRNTERLERASKVFNRHEGLTIIARSRGSYDFGKDAFDCDVRLAPDMAFAIDYLVRTTGPRHEIVWLRRSDLERAPYEVPRSHDMKEVDWSEPGPIQQLNLTLADIPRASFIRSGARRLVHISRNKTAPLLGRWYPYRARSRTARGADMLSQGRVVITDRLHGHILCLLLGIPHVLLDNSYGKLRDFYETWTADEPLARRSESPGDALRTARDFLSA